MATSDNAHSGRWQAQGGLPKIEKSRPWNLALPLRLTPGLNLLEELTRMLTHAERKEREGPLVQAATYARHCASQGGKAADGKSKSFYARPWRNAIRIDLEVTAGIAFVPDDAAGGGAS